jgi:hypothetical protein
MMQMIPWTSLFLLTQHFGLRLYTLKTRDECLAIQKKIGTNCSQITDGGRASGYSIGFWYFLNITIGTSNHGDSYSVWLIATPDSYKALTKGNQDSTNDECMLLSSDGDCHAQKKKSFMIIERMGSFHNCYFRKRTHTLNYTPRPVQQDCMDCVKEVINVKKHAVILLYGPPGSGKSFVSLMLAESMGGIYCNSFQPWIPGDTLGYLYMEAEPTAERPLIVSFDEFDSALLDIHTGKIVQHKSLLTSVCNKKGWNQMLDEIQRGLYPHLILVLSTNKTPEYIDSLDPSYIRPGRVDMMKHIG